MSYDASMYKKGYEQGRADMIDEILMYIREMQTHSMPIREMMGICKVGEYIEALKEKADE